MMMSAICGILFDLDNTLLDHEAAAKQAFISWAAEMAIDPNSTNMQHWSAAERKFPPTPQRGVTMSTTRAYRMQEFLSAATDGPPTAEHEELIAHYGRYLEHYERSWNLYRDVLGSVARLRRQFRIGLLTNGASELQRRKLEKTGLDTLFDAIVVSEEIECAKPAADAFAIACRLLRLDPRTVLYVGDDSRIDIDGAIGAGLQAELIERQGTGGDTVLHELTNRLLSI
ncbi:HAD family hydrolase [uncultured Microbacterium sp.]|uniref:HAD family hydrolase n=1 Tax=uncultured Microbacterium sp. TaxID=191216 RepID=UPI0025EB8425|nr:HAD family hydrolase [uncultured Microbacterium sp.]